MSVGSEQTVVLFSGLPYTGKTALIRGLLAKLPGRAIYIDGLFRDAVPEEEISLDRWLEEGPYFVEQISGIIGNARESRIYVELGIMKAAHRGELIRRILNFRLRLVPVLLECSSESAIRQRQEQRERELTQEGADKVKIGIGLDELHNRISAVFERPEKREGFFAIDTAGPIAQTLEEVARLITSTAASPGHD